MLRCDVCGVDIPSENVMTAHISGKKHRRMEEYLQKKTREAARSVYIKNPPCECTQAELTEIFSQFGQVLNVYLEPKSRFFAIVEFQSEESAKELLKNLPIKYNGKELKVRPRELKSKTERTQKQAEFRQQKEILLLEREENERKHQQIVRDALMSAANIEEQMTKLTSCLRLTDNEIRHRLGVLQKLQTILRTFIPGCEVLPFGSSANSLAVTGSDVDVSVNLNEDKPELHKANKNIDEQRVYAIIMKDDFPGLVIEEGYATPESLKTLTQTQQIKLISQVLKSMGRDEFFVLRTITNAKVAVIKAMASREDLAIDITVNNTLAVRNTEWIRLMLSLDHRVLPLVFSVRFWAKSRSVGGGKSYSYVTNYALTTLVFHFLCNTIPPVLPSVTQLAAGSGYTKMIDGWDCSFDDKSSFKSENQESLPELLRGFFRYYNSLDFSSHVVNLNNAKIEKIEDFKSKQATNHQLTNFQITGINIQDPFELNHNIAQNVAGDIPEKLQRELKLAVEKCESTEFEANCNEASTSQKLLGLLYLCSDAGQRSELTEVHSFEFRTSHHDSKSVMCLIKRILTEVLLIEVQIKTDSPNKTSGISVPSSISQMPEFKSIPSDHDKFQGSSSQNRLDDCDNDEPPMKKSRTEDPRRTTETQEFRCHAKYRLWDDRASQASSLETSKEILDSPEDEENSVPTSGMKCYDRSASDDTRGNSMKHQDNLLIAGNHGDDKQSDSQGRHGNTKHLTEPPCVVRELEVSQKLLLHGNREADLTFDLSLHKSSSGHELCMRKLGGKKKDFCDLFSFVKDFIPQMLGEVIV